MWSPGLGVLLLVLIGHRTQVGGLLLQTVRIEPYVVTTTGGLGGAPGALSCSFGQDGPAASATGAAPVTLPGPPRRLSVGPNPLREGVTANVVLQGVPGNLAFLLLSPNVAAFYTPTFGGATLVDAPVTDLFAGTLDGSGAKVIPLTLGNLGAGVDTASLSGQLFTWNPTESFTLGSRQVLVLFDASF